MALTPKQKLESASKKSKIPLGVLSEVYKRAKGTSLERQQYVNNFIKRGCYLKNDRDLVNKALIQMSQNDAKLWCKKQIKKSPK